LHLLGTDGFGRDVLTRLLFGSRVSLLVGATAVFIAGLIGTAMGLVTGYKGGWVEDVVMRLADAQQAIPPILLAIIVVSVFGANITNLIGVLGMSGWVIYARIIFARTLSLRRGQFVEAALALGATTERVLIRHLLPNILGQIIALSTLQAGRMILLEASLSFLGLGVPPPTASWGSMLAEAQPLLFVSSWQVTLPGLAIVITVWSVNTLGEGLRQHLDPQTRK
jgi:peptide/nickel transport system permease protein